MFIIRLLVLYTVDDAECWYFNKHFELFGIQLNQQAVIDINIKQ